MEYGKIKQVVQIIVTLTPQGKVKERKKEEDIAEPSNIVFLQTQDEKEFLLNLSTFLSEYLGNLHNVITTTSLSLYK
jgi:hypothetical protein